MTQTSQFPYNVLIVEDVPDICNMLDMLLTIHGYTTTCTTNGHEALAALQQIDVLPSVIVTDLAMPTMTGSELVNVLAQHPTWRSIPIIVISAMYNVKNATAALNVAAVLAKPFLPEHLLAAIATIVEQVAPLEQQ